MALFKLSYMIFIVTLILHYFEAMGYHFILSFSHILNSQHSQSVRHGSRPGGYSAEQDRHSHSSQWPCIIQGGTQVGLGW